MIDVIIAGAGPAGAVAALVLARAGANVRLFDRAVFPRDKLCGDTLNPGARAVLQRLGLSCVADAGLPISGMVVTGEGGVRVEGRYPRGHSGRAIVRRDLDYALLNAAIGAGAHFDERVLAREPILGSDGVEGLVIQSAGGTVSRERARIVIAADGRGARLGRWLGLVSHPARPRRWAVGAYFTDVAGTTDCGEMHVRQDRYLGIAPLPGGLTNACVVTDRRDLLHDPALLLPSTLAGDAEFSARFVNARMVARPMVMGPLALECQIPGTRGLFLAGDTAGFIDPMTGDGLRFALRGGELAADEAVRALERGWGDAHVRLALRRREEFTTKWRFNRTLRACVASPRALRAAGAAASLLPSLLERTIAFAGDVHLASAPTRA